MDCEASGRYARGVGPISKIGAVCACALVLAGGVALSAAAGGGHSGGDSGQHQYGPKPACKKGHGGDDRSYFGSRKDCPKKPRYDH